MESVPSPSPPFSSYDKRTYPWSWASRGRTVTLGCGWLWWWFFSFFFFSLLLTYLAPRSHRHKHVDAQKNPRRETRCVRFSPWSAYRLAWSPPPLRSSPHRRSARLHRGSQKRTERRTHAPGSPPVVNITTRCCLLLPSSGGSDVKLAWLCASTLTPRSSSVHCHNHWYHFWVHCSR